MRVSPRGTEVKKTSPPGEPQITFQFILNPNAGTYRWIQVGYYDSGKFTGILYGYVGGGCFDQKYYEDNQPYDDVEEYEDMQEFKRCDAVFDEHIDRLVSDCREILYPSSEVLGEYAKQGKHGLSICSMQGTIINPLQFGNTWF